jgi:M6 family metalloprotease-like protein
MLCTASHAVQIRREPGHRIPEYILPTDPDNPALWTSSPSPVYTRAAAPGAYSTKDIPRFGTIEYPLILVEFSDRFFSITDRDILLERYENMFNKSGYTDNTKYKSKHKNGQEYEYYGATGSVSDYFKAQSYGQYIPKFNIIGPIRLSKSYAYYGQGIQDISVRIKELVRETCDSIITHGNYNLSGYARNGNIDQLSIIYAGRGENYEGSDPNTIWPQADTCSYNNKKSGIKDIKYLCTCELFWDSDTILDGIGTFCHEFSHTLGLPDFYNTDPYSGNLSTTDAAMGYWSLMDYGNYENLGFSPVGYTAFEKYSLGWIDIEEITYSGLYQLSDISIQPNPNEDVHCAYRLSAGSDDQFIILESHSKTGWYKFHASEGLMVTSVNYTSSIWTNNKINRSQKHYRILPADNNYHRDTNAGDLFPYGQVDSITTLGTPVLAVKDKDKKNILDSLLYPMYSIYGIRKEAGKVTFYAGADMPSGVKNRPEQEITIGIADGNLSVYAPSGSRVTVHDISGKTVLETVTTNSTQQIELPGNGIWIVKCGDTVRKIKK